MIGIVSCVSMQLTSFMQLSSSTCFLLKWQNWTFVCQTELNLYNKFWTITFSMFSLPYLDSGINRRWCYECSHIPLVIVYIYGINNRNWACVTNELCRQLKLKVKETIYKIWYYMQFKAIKLLLIEAFLDKASKWIIMESSDSFYTYLTYMYIHSSHNGYLQDKNCFRFFLTFIYFTALWEQDESESESEWFSAAVTDDYYTEAWVLVLGGAKMIEGRNEMRKDET